MSFIFDIFFEDVVDILLTVGNKSLTAFNAFPAESDASDIVFSVALNCSILLFVFFNFVITSVVVAVPSATTFASSAVSITLYTIAFTNAWSRLFSIVPIALFTIIGAIGFFF